ncbi:MAG TPA: D-alanine--D-alanine ligase [Solirubrobacterales bacterium]|nr:D-alanine--D-alanine ligase [Solirubrobacterales bacterium]
MKVALLQGGRSLERGVSLRSGARVAEALSDIGHEVEVLDLGPDLVAKLEGIRPDVAFIALHGTEGEDGTVQALLDLLDIPHTGPGVAACQRCMDKSLAKHILRENGLPTPNWVTYSEAAIRDFGAASSFQRAVDTVGLPLVAKPASQGSSLGVKVVTRAEDIPGALMTALSYDNRAILETWVSGRELAVSVLGDQVLPIVEAIPTDNNAYDFEARYEIGGASFVCPAELSDEDADEVNRVALAAYNALGCSGFSRVDLILGDDGPQILEINAIPGLTETSLLPQAAEAAGVEFEAMVARIIDLAL